MPAEKKIPADDRAAMRKLSIASVTVAYNGAHRLRQHLDALKRQTRKIDEIVVVNNASSDGTPEFLAAKYPEVTVLNLPENGGVGAGFAAGLAYAAFTQKHDWIWLFDQDSAPSNDGLERLLRGLQYVDDTCSLAILAPVCADPETGMTCSGHTWREGRFVSTAADPFQAVTLVDSVISSGSLLRREAVETAGLPRADFFMDFIDHEHCLRLRRQGFKVAVVRDSHLSHVLGNPRRFTIFGCTKFWTDHAPWREYYMTRNEVFTVWLYYPQWKARVLALYRLFRHALAILVFGKQKLACLRMMFFGLIDGLAGRLGIRFTGATPNVSEIRSDGAEKGRADLSRSSVESKV